MYPKYARKTRLTPGILKAARDFSGLNGLHFGSGDAYFYRSQVAKFGQNHFDRACQFVRAQHEQLMRMVR